MGRVVHCLCVLVVLLLAASRVHAASPAEPEVVYSFCWDARQCCPDTPDCVAAAHPADLVRGIDGAYYGVTRTWNGIVYRMDPATHAVSIVHRFDPAREGSSPQYELFAASDGSLYGALEDGPNPTGASQAFPGSLFRISRTGRFSVVYRFRTIGAYAAVSAEDSHGNLYGKLYPGNVYAVPGAALFRISSPQDRPMPSLRILHVFTYPLQSVSDLVYAADGRLYGTTPFFRQPSGDPGYGIVFRMTTTGIFTILHVNDGGHSGESRLHGLAAGPDGALYGTVGRNAFRVGLDGRYAVIGDDALPSPEPPVLMPDGTSTASTVTG